MYLTILAPDFVTGEGLLTEKRAVKAQLLPDTGLALGNHALSDLKEY
jgi:hypothetical protein